MVYRTLYELINPIGKAIGKPRQMTLSMKGDTESVVRQIVAYCPNNGNGFLVKSNTPIRKKKGYERFVVQFYRDVPTIPRGTTSARFDILALLELKRCIHERWTLPEEVFSTQS
jgi:hypothetical protein